MFMKKKQTIKKAHTQEEQDKFIHDVGKQLKKFFNTKEDLTSILIMAGNDTKNIGIAAGDTDKAIALMYDLTKRMGTDYIAALCGLLLKDLTEKEVHSLVKTMAAVAGVKGKKSTLH